MKLLKISNKNFENTIASILHVCYLNQSEYSDEKEYIEVIKAELVKLEKKH